MGHPGSSHADSVGPIDSDTKAVGTARLGPGRDIVISSRDLNGSRVAPTAGNANAAGLPLPAVAASLATTSKSTPSLPVASAGRVRLSGFAFGIVVCA